MRAFSAFFQFLFIILNGLHQDFYGMITVGKHRREPRNNDDKHQLCVHGFLLVLCFEVLQLFWSSEDQLGQDLPDRWDWDIAG